MCFCPAGVRIERDVNGAMGLEHVSVRLEEGSVGERIERDVNGTVGLECVSVRLEKGLNVMLMELWV